jgi:hypothetical protein
MTCRKPAAILLLSLLCAAGCGGSERPAKSASEGDGEAASAGDEDATGASEGGDDAASEGTESAETARKPRCDDGTCTPCGSSLCPSGWYCDEGAKGGPACGWLPECAQKPSCACVKRAFSDCACEDQGGAAHLTCS